MTVRAKFFVTEIKHAHTTGSGVFAYVVLAPVYGSYPDNQPNESWSKATPQGKIELGVTNENAIGEFELGKAYYIDFTPADLVVTGPKGLAAA